jgi:putative ABC transport system ATP-binding protein
MVQPPVTSSAVGASGEMGGPSAAAIVLEARDVTKRYVLDEVVVNALDSVELEVRRGEMLAIMGPSGSGKSTLMHIIGLLDHPTSGTVTIDGQDVSDMKPNQLAAVRNKRIGFVFQSFNLLARTTAVANVELPLIYAGILGGERARRAKAALERVGLGERLRHMPNQLSGGQQQRVAIARALVTEPSIVLADEPTGNLDSRSGVEVMQILQGLNDQGITVVLVTHDARVARHAQRVVHIADGRIVLNELVDDRIIASAEIRHLADEARIDTVAENLSVNVKHGV